MTSDKPLVSVVVPIYKSEAWLYDCIDSILSQTLFNIEVILVDDGSPDNCGLICDEYVKRDARVRVIHKDNDGVSMARKTGVDNATADYISFVDADDTLPITALEYLYREIGGSDIIIGRHEDGKYEKEFLTPDENRSLAISGGYFINSSWARLIARHLFNENTFPPKEVVNGEDMIMNINLAFANRKPVRLINKKVYNYIRHSESAAHTFQDSVEYETLLNKYRNAAIPIEQRGFYARECLKNRLIRFNDIYRANRRNEWYGTPYYHDFIKCSKQCDYHIPLSQQIKLRITNTTLLRLYMMGESFITYRYRKLKKLFIL